MLEQSSELTNRGEVNRRDAERGGGAMKRGGDENGGE